MKAGSAKYSLVQKWLVSFQTLAWTEAWSPSMTRTGSMSCCFAHKSRRLPSHYCRRQLKELKEALKDRSGPASFLSVEHLVLQVEFQQIGLARGQFGLEDFRTLKSQFSGQRFHPFLKYRFGSLGKLIVRIQRSFGCNFSADLVQPRGKFRGPWLWSSGYKLQRYLGTRKQILHRHPPDCLQRCRASTGKVSIVLDPPGHRSIVALRYSQAHLQSRQGHQVSDCALELGRSLVIDGATYSGPFAPTLALYG